MKESPTSTIAPTARQAWASWLGIVAVIFGVLFTAAQGTEWMRQTVIAPGSAAVAGAEPDCPADELVEEGISPLECELLIANVQILIASSPDWFRGFKIVLAAFATLSALLSIAAGVALVDGRPWAPGVAATILTILFAIDVIGFAAASATGPLLRAIYLWDHLLWAAIHLVMLVAAIAGRETMRSSRSAQRPVREPAE